MNNTLENLIKTAMSQLEDEFNLTAGTLKSYKYRSFRPIEDLFKLHGLNQYDQKLIDELQALYATQFEKGDISRETFAWRTRGIGIISEIQIQGYFEWKIFIQTKKEALDSYFEEILNDFLETLDCNPKSRRDYESIIRRFLSFLVRNGSNNFTNFDPTIINDFLTEISHDRPGSMDDVFYSLRKLFLCLNESGIVVDFNILLLACPKRHKSKVYPCMNIDEVSEVLNHIDQTTPKGKRDYAIVLLAATTGLRAGDLIRLKLKNINWKQCEISIIQGKTKRSLTLPLSLSSRDALADYILNGRPTSNSPNIFLRSIAPYTELVDGTSVSCILRRYLKSMGVKRENRDGKTFHGIRRMLASSMTTSEVPVTTIAQVLGHKDMDVTKRYISLDMEQLRNCTLGFSSLNGGEAK